jgi:DNA-binding MarR family transcriptional regulator
VKQLQQDIKGDFVPVKRRRFKLSPTAHLVLAFLKANTAPIAGMKAVDVAERMELSVTEVRTAMYRLSRYNLIYSKKSKALKGASRLWIAN